MTAADPAPRRSLGHCGPDLVVEDVAYAFVERLARHHSAPLFERSDKAASRVAAALCTVFGVDLSTGPRGLGAVLRNALGYAPVPCVDGCGCRWLEDADSFECGCGGPCSRWTDRPAMPTGDDEGPEAGHTFYLDARSRGAARVGDGPASDADFVGSEPFRIAVRAHDLPTALRKAAALPLGEWIAPGEHDDRPGITPDPLVEAARALVAIDDDPMVCAPGGQRFTDAIDQVRRALPPEETTR